MRSMVATALRVGRHSAWSQVRAAASKAGLPRGTEWKLLQLQGGEVPAFISIESLFISFLG